MEYKKSLKSKKNNLKILILSLFSIPLIAETNNWTETSDSDFDPLISLASDWISGNIGKTLALIGFMATFIAYMTTHKGSTLFIGTIFSFVAGGLVGIIGSFFNIGTLGFESSVP
jgi:hypothetical protein